MHMNIKKELHNTKNKILKSSIIIDSVSSYCMQDFYSLDCMIV